MNGLKAYTSQSQASAKTNASRFEMLWRPAAAGAVHTGRHPLCCVHFDALYVCRYSPNFSKRCTHLIVSTEQSDASQLKLYLASINKDKWHAQAVRFEWLLECASQSRQVDEDAFAVEAPKYEVSHCCSRDFECMMTFTSWFHLLQDLSILQQRLQEVATPSASAAGESNVPGVHKARAHSVLH